MHHKSSEQLNSLFIYLTNCLLPHQCGKIATVLVGAEGSSELTPGGVDGVSWPLCGSLSPETHEDAEDDAVLLWVMQMC